MKYIVTAEGRRAVMVTADNENEAEEKAVRKFKRESSYAGDLTIKDINKSGKR